MNLQMMIMGAIISLCRNTYEESLTDLEVEMINEHDSDIPIHHRPGDDDSEIESIIEQKLISENLRSVTFIVIIPLSCNFWYLVT